MKRQAFQHPELRDANDNIIQEGTYGKESPLVNSDNTGVLDYINNNLEALYDNINGGTGGEINTETITGKTGTITSLTATTVKAGTLTADALNGPLTGNVTGDVTGNVTGDVTGNLTGNVTGTADKAVADGNGNNIANTYVTKSALASSVTTETGKVTTLTATDSTLTNLTVTGTTSVPTANAGNSSKAIANTEYVQGELTNYLPLSGGTMTGNTLITMGNGESYVRNWANGLYLGGTAENNASTLVLFTNSNASGFQLQAGNGTTSKRLIGKPDGTLTWDGQPLLPVGIVQAFAGTTIPSGWLLCDGSAVSRTDYAALYAVIGTTYGAGNGSTTFNLPNLTNKFIQGNATAGTVKSAGLPNITGKFQKIYTYSDQASATGAFSLDANATVNGPYENHNTNKGLVISLDASRSSSVYGNSTTVQPPALTMRYIIKY